MDLLLPPAIEPDVKNKSGHRDHVQGDAYSTQIILARKSRFISPDVGIAVILFVVALIGYGLLSHRLAQGKYFEYFNLAFDFDPFLAFSLLTLSPYEELGFKHPLLLLMRPFGQTMLAAGLPPKEAAAMVTAMIGAATVPVVWYFLRSIGSKRIEALSLTLLFAVSSTQMFTAIIPESYGLSGLAIAFVWLIAHLRTKSPTEVLTSWRYFGSLVLMGATITNITHAFIAEFMVAKRRFRTHVALTQTVKFGIIFFSMFIIVVLAVWHVELWNAARDPVAAAKKIWWLQTSGPKSDVIEVLKTFFGFSFVAPNYTYVMLPEQTNMRDFRQWSFSAIGASTVVAWFIFWSVGLVCTLMNRSYRAIAFGMLLALVLNILFHTQFQYRGSIFIYAAHTHFLIFAIGAGAAPMVAGLRGIRLAYISAVLALASLIAVNNFPVLMEFTTAFHKPDTTCPAPCS